MLRVLLINEVAMGCSVLGRGAEPLVRTQFLEHPPTLNHPKSAYLASPPHRNRSTTKYDFSSSLLAYCHLLDRV